jgi:lipoprotein-anchoring transpeptidase ErfK/SrfK
VTIWSRVPRRVVSLDGMQRGVRLLCSLPLLGLLAGCGSTAEHVATVEHVRTVKHSEAAPRPKPRPRVAAKPRCGGAPGRQVGSSRVAVAAVVRSSARAFRLPGRGELASFGRLNQNGFPTVFRVLTAVRGRNCGSVWYRVQLPMRPNGVTGYVEARSVELGKVRTRIVVDLSSRRLTFLRDGQPVLRATVAIGASATPTPTGHYYVNQKLVPIDAAGPYGPGAIGISAFSPVLTGWAQGGPVAIHGTNEPWSIGRPVSNGCIRLHNPVLRRLFAATPAGTPVLIRR